MLKDSARTGCYQRAILDNSVLFKNKVVLDVGAGTGEVIVPTVSAFKGHVSVSYSLIYQEFCLFLPHALGLVEFSPWKRVKWPYNALRLSNAIMYHEIMLVCLLIHKSVLKSVGIWITKILFYRLILHS